MEKPEGVSNVQVYTYTYSDLPPPLPHVTTTHWRIQRPVLGGGAKSFGGSNLTYPHFQLSPRISATLFSKHRILTIFYFMFNFYINFCQIPQAIRAELADLAEGPSLAFKRPSLTNRRLLTRALEGGLRITPTGGGGILCPPHRSQLL